MSSRRPVLAALALATTLAVSACGSTTASSGNESPTSGAAAPQESTFPVTVTHALGTATIEKKPERVATLGWGNHEVPLALGIVPVGMSKAVWGDDDKDGVLPWVEDRIRELGGQTPVLFDDSDSIDFEAVANTRPDVILAAYSGLTKEQYDTLSRIAPVVAYPKTAWTTSLADMVTLNSQGLGMAAQGEKLAADLDRRITDIAAKHPEVAGRTTMFSFIDTTDLGKIGFYNDLDPRQQLLTKVGMRTPGAVAATKDSGAFFSTVSAEKADTFSDVDLIVTYGKDPAATLRAVRADPLWKRIPAVQTGRVAVLADDTPLAAVGNPSPLNIAWGLDRYLGEIGSAVTRK